MKPAIGIAGLWFLLLTALPAFAIDTEKSPVQLTLVPQAPRSRNGAMIVVEARLISTLPRVVEGTLELTYFTDNQRSLRVSVPDVAVAQGEQTLMLSLPAPPQIFSNQFTVDARLLSERQALDLGQHLLFVPGFNQRGFVIAISDPWAGSMRRLGDLLATLPLERFQPREADPNVWREPLASTMPVSLHPDRLPTTAVGYTPFDIVVLADEGFAAAPPRALEALAQWVRAGGSVLIIPSGRSDAAHAAMLTTLAAQTPNAPAFTLDQGGRLAVSGGDAGAKAHRFHAGLGRAVIATDSFDPTQDLAGREWTEAVLFLWKVRKSQLEPMAGGAWGPGHLATPNWIQETVSDPVMAPSLAPVQQTSLIGVSQSLAPRKLRLVPLPAIALLLLAYVLAIGPLDYFVLGRLKKRAWTWVLLPVVTVLATFSMMQLSRHYMGASHSLRTFHVIDLDSSNAMLRHVQLQVRFSASDRIDRAEYRQDLVTPLMLENHLGTQSGMPLEVIGRAPAAFVVEQRLSQWTSAMRRVTSLEPEPIKHAIDLTGLAEADLHDLTQRAAIISRIKQASRAQRVYIHGQQPMNIWVKQIFDRVLTRTSENEFDFASPLLLLSPVPQNLFSIVSQISPTGGPSLEDLAVLDPTDPDQWLVIVEIHDGDDIYHYRHLIRKAR